MKRVTVPTYYANIWIAGDYEAALSACHKFCERGACVTLTPTAYVYTGGAEAGVCVRLINYPRFPSTPDQIRALAEALAAILLTDLGQQSYSIEYPDETVWVSYRPADNSPESERE